MSPSKSEDQPWSLPAKLDEMLFDGSARELVSLLAIPIRPPNSAYPNPVPPALEESREKQGYNSSPRGTVLSGQLKPKSDDNVLAGVHEHYKLAQTKYPNSNGKVGNNFATISSLPTELHRLIFSNIGSIEDIISLGLTNRNFWTIGREHVHRHYESMLGQWANKILFCSDYHAEPVIEVGDDVNSTDLPCMAEGAGMEKSEETHTPHDIYYPLNAEENAPGLIRYRHWGLWSLSHVQTRDSLLTESATLNYKCKDRGMLHDAGYQRVRNEIFVDDSTYFPQDRQWILRNKLMKEFVRAEAIALRPEFIHGPHIDVLGFGEVLMTRICLLGGSDAIAFGFGEWAGRYFDITTLAQHEADEHAWLWKDVSEKVAEEIAAMRERKYGPNWREIVINVRNGGGGTGTGEDQ